MRKWIAALLPLSVAQVIAPAYAQQTMPSMALAEYLAFLTSGGEMPNVPLPPTFFFNGGRGSEAKQISELKALLSGCTLITTQESYSYLRSVTWTGNCPGGLGRTVKLVLKGTTREVREVEVTFRDSLVALPSAPPLSFAVPVPPASLAIPAPPAPPAVPAQVVSSRVQDVAAAFRAKDWGALKRMTVDESILVNGLERLYSPTVLSRDQLLESLKACEVKDVFERGVRYQTSDGLYLTCPGTELRNDPCQVEEYFLDLTIGDRVRISAMHRTSDRNRAKCGPTPPPPLAPPRPGSN